MKTNSPNRFDPLVQQDLDHVECDNPDCSGGHPTFVVAKCHPGEGVDAGYERGTGCLVIFCHVCKQPVCRIEVAKASVQ
jgi:hypothetical protein